MTFERLAEYFKECFPEDQFSYNGDNRTWIYAAPKGLTNDDSIHCELTQRGNSNLAFVEFHIED